MPSQSRMKYLQNLKKKAGMSRDGKMEIDNNSFETVLNSRNVDAVGYCDTEFAPGKSYLLFAISPEYLRIAAGLHHSELTQSLIRAPSYLLSMRGVTDSS